MEHSPIVRATERLKYAGRMVKYFVTLLNRRGTLRDAPERGFDKGRVMGFRFTDKDIRDAERLDPGMKRVFKFRLSPHGQVERVRDRNVVPDVLMYCTLTTLTLIANGRLNVQQATKARLLQVRYLNKQLEQEEEFIKDVAIRLRVMNDIVEEVLKDRGASFPTDDA